MFIYEVNLIQVSSRESTEKVNGIISFFLFLSGKSESKQGDVTKFDKPIFYRTVMEIMQCHLSEGTNTSSELLWTL